MVNLIINQFDMVTTKYQEMINISEDIFLALKERRFNDLEMLNIEETKGMNELQNYLMQLKEVVTEACENEGLKENKLSSLLPLLKGEEAEKLMACQETAFHFEKKLKNNTKMNKCLVEAMMKTSQTIVDTWVYFANKEKKNNSFVNKKL